MDNIVNIKERLESREQQRQLKQDRSHDTDSSGQEYTFCDNCREEFEDFISSSKGKKHHRVFWHNKEWKEMWSAWLNYKQAIADFINSREFKLLLEELDNQS